VRPGRLAVLLRVRRVQEETARGGLATARAATRGAVGRREDAEQAYAGATLRSAAPARELRDWMAGRTAQQALAGQLRVLRTAETTRTTEEQAAAAAWSQAARALSALDRLDELAAARVRAALAAADVRAADDLTTARWIATAAAAEETV